MLALLNALPGSVAQGLIWGIMAIGVYITYRVLDFADLSVDGSFCTGGAVAVMLMLGGWNVVPALIVAFLTGLLAGYITGLLHTYLRIPGILAGILTQLGLYSINLAIMGKANQAISVDKYNLAVSLRYINKTIIVSIIIVVVIIALLYAFFGTEIGSAIRATGANQNMARAQGINTGRCIRMGVALSNGIVAFAGGLYSQYQGNADVNAGRGAIVIGLAAVIIGEVIFGTKHSFATKLATSVVGAIIYYIIIAIVLQLGLPSSYLKLLSACLVAIFLGLPAIKNGIGTVKPDKED